MLYMSVIDIWAKLSLNIFISSLTPVGSNFLLRQVLFILINFARCLFPPSFHFFLFFVFAGGGLFVFNEKKFFLLHF